VKIRYEKNIWSKIVTLIIPLKVERWKILLTNKSEI